MVFFQHDKAYALVVLFKLNVLQLRLEVEWWICWEELNSAESITPNTEVGKFCSLHA